MQQNTINYTHNEGNFRFLLICHVQKFEISPHDRFFLHGRRPCVRDKYQVCLQIYLIVGRYYLPHENPKEGRGPGTKSKPRKNQMKRLNSGQGTKGSHPLKKTPIL